MYHSIRPEGVLPAALAVLLVMLSGTESPAQDGLATVRGTVFGSSGAPAPRAAVGAKHLGTGQSREVASDEQGKFEFPRLAPGSYEFTASSGSSLRQTRTGLNLAAGQVLPLDFRLELTSGEQGTASPGDRSRTPQSSSSTKAQLINENLLVGLPLNGRSYTQLATLEAGVSDSSATSASRGVGGGNLTVSGGRNVANTFLLDGTNIMDTGNRAPRSAAGVQLGSDAVLQVQVFSTNYGAEYGRGSGGVLNSITRSGSDELHGTLFEYFRNSKLDARNFFDQGPEPPPFKRNQFGATVTGPIRKGKTFFTASFEELLDRLSQTELDTFVDAEARQGIITNAQGEPIRQVTVSSAVKPYLAVIPIPRGGRVGGGFSNLIEASFLPTSESFFAIRVDHQVADRDSLFVRYSFDDAASTQGGGTSLFSTKVASRQQYATLVVSHIFSPRLLTSLRFGFTRPVSTSESVSSLPPIPRSLYFVPDAPSFGQIAVGGGAAFGPPVNQPAADIMNSFQLSGDVLAQREDHGLKFGVDIHRYRWDVFSNFNKGATWSFNSVDNFLEGGSEGTSLTVALPGSDNTKAYRQTLVGLYGQDEYRVRPSFQLSFGFRYEFATLLHDRYGRDSFLADIVRDSQVGVGSVLKSNPSLKNFSPRFGLTWSPTGSRGPVIRSGFGIYYDQLLGYAMDNQKNAFPFYQVAVRTNFNSSCAGRNPTCTFPDAIAAATSAGGLPVQAQTLDYQNMKSPMVLRYDFSIQQRLPKDSNVQIAYVGARGNHLFRSYEANLFPVPIVLSDGSLCFPPDAALNPVVNPSCPPVSSERAGPVNPAFRGGITLLGSDAQSFYNSFLLTADTRPNPALTLRFNYTFSKSIDDSSSLGSSANYQYELRRSLERGLSDYNLRHRIAINYFYTFPSLRGGGTLSRVLSPIFGSWRLGGIVNFRTGTATTIKINVRRAGYLFAATRPNLRPGQSNNPTHGVSSGCNDPVTGALAVPAGQSIGTKNILFDPCAFSVPEPGTLGNVGRNTVFGSSVFTTDMSLQREFSLGNSRRLQFRAELFNVMNQTNLRPPGASGTVVFTGPGRFNAQAGHYFGTAATSRQIQFALRLSF